MPFRHSETYPFDSPTANKFRNNADFPVGWYVKKLVTGLLWVSVAAHES